MTENPIDQIAVALAEARKNFKPILRSKKVRVGAGASSYEFSYAPFEEIVDAVSEALTAQGLSVIQGAAGDVLISTLIHKSGQSIDSSVPLVFGADKRPQQVGSALTYARRYGLQCLLCLAADDDDDANSAEGNTVEAVKLKERKAPGVVPETPQRHAARRFIEFAKNAMNSQHVIEFLKLDGRTIAGVRLEDRFALTMLMTVILGTKPSPVATIEELDKCSSRLADLEAEGNSLGVKP